MIDEIPMYAYDERHGYMVSVPPPFSLICLLMLPAQLVSDKNLKKFNNRLFLFLQYIPLGLVMTILFALITAFLGPLAYAKSALHKTLLFLKQRRAEMFSEMLIFLLFGGFFIGFHFLIDIIVFTRSLFSWNQSEEQITKDHNVLTPKILA